MFPEDEAEAVLKPAYRAGAQPHEMAEKYYARVQNADEVTKKQYLDMNMWLPGDILLKADKMCMAHSLELRVPFLDKEVMTFAEGIPTRFRVQGTDTKVVLRHAANKTLPDEWGQPPQKGLPGAHPLLAARGEILQHRQGIFHKRFRGRLFRHQCADEAAGRPFPRKGRQPAQNLDSVHVPRLYKRFFVDEK